MKNFEKGFEKGFEGRTPERPPQREKPSMILIIDDNEEYINSLLRIFRGKEEALPVVCKSKEEVLRIIEKYCPTRIKYIFLDHHLSEEEKGEGLEIAREIKEKYPYITIYSITSDSSAKKIPRNRNRDSF